MANLAKSMFTNSAVTRRLSLAVWPLFSPCASSGGPEDEMVNYATDRGCGEKEYASKNLAQDDGREWAGDGMQRDQGKWWGDRGRLLRKRLTVNKLLSLLMRGPTSGWMNAEQHFLLQRRDWTESQKGEKNSDAKKQRDRMVKRPKEELQRTDSDGKARWSSLSELH